MKVELNLEKERTKLDMSDLLPFYAVYLFSGKKIIAHTCMLLTEISSFSQCHAIYFYRNSARRTFWKR